MTKVVFERNENTFSLCCSGHAGYGEKGKDIVCAGISALCGALEIALDNLQKTGMAQTYFCSWGDGVFRAEATAASAKTGVETAFELVYGGLCRIEEEYSPHLNCHRYVKEKEMTV
ncbi:MAG: ribosomal-processing cysteine protease Prp [Clostridia bacterium]|nr:ribosomal-processing cysteine protease Prp [Clostridia bacterium]MBR2415016.1 ribosomal-processing cysteine protease Prp [Clostridia bacterium]